LELLKNAPNVQPAPQADKPPDPQPEDSKKPGPVKEEMAKHLVLEAKQPANVVQVPKELKEKTESLAATVKTVLNSLQGEKFPPLIVLDTAASACEKVLTGIPSCASVEGRAAAERALKGTIQCITVMTEAGTSANDTDLVAMQKRKSRQEAEVSRLTAKAPSLKVRRLALVEAQDAFLKDTQSGKEISEKGKQKALTRDKERLKKIDEMVQIVEDLRQQAMEQFNGTSEAHDRRSAEKAKLAEDVNELLEGKYTRSRLSYRNDRRKWGSTKKQTIPTTE
jgi:hypothetical protein